MSSTMFNWGSVFKTQQMCFYSSSDTVFVFVLVSGINTSSSLYTSQYFVAFVSIASSATGTERVLFKSGKKVGGEEWFYRKTEN
jgi:hypothetical protein